jgi:hypothetical protein
MLREARECLLPSVTIRSAARTTGRPTGRPRSRSWPSRRPEASVGVGVGVLTFPPVSRPLDVEHAPELINLRLLLGCPAACLYGHGNQCSRDGSTLPSLNSKVNGRHVPHRRLPLEGIKILGFGPLTLAKDDECLPWSSCRDLPFEWT